MLAEQQIISNKNRFIEILSKVTRAGSNIPELIDRMERGGFFTSPASTSYHSNCEGGLCDHSLKVYDTLTYLVKQSYPSEITDSNGTVYVSEDGKSMIDSDSIIIVSLLHDLCKMGFYEEYFRNEKRYSPTGTKKDDRGFFDWVSVKGYKIAPAKNRFTYSTHGHNSEYMVGGFIPLTGEESLAIIHHMGVTPEVNLIDQSYIFSNHPLAALLHAADFISTFTLEKVDE